MTRTTRIALVLVLCAWTATPAGAQRPNAEKSGMVVAQDALAAEVGGAVLERGGNAIDAAVATAFALAVTHPTAGNVGGGGFLVWRGADGRTTSFDFRETAPRRATPTMFVGPDGRPDDAARRDSHRSVGVPGTVAGLFLAHERLGVLPWASLVEPAVALAREGFVVGDDLAASLAAHRERLARHPASRAIFLHPDGRAWRAGERLVQTDLAATLARIAELGPEGFYRGETADLVAAEMERGGGLIDAEDLAGYAAVERPCVEGDYRGWRVIGMGPPSSGGAVLIHMLDMLETRPVEREPVARLHLLAEVMRRAFAARARLLGDVDGPDADDRAWRSMLDPEVAARAMADFDPAAASRSVAEGQAWTTESEHTTHLSAVDAEGAAVALTVTIEQPYGSAITVAGAGFLLNDEMGDFNPVPGLTDEDGNIGTPPNRIAPGRRMLSSMCPTIVVDSRGRTRFVLGSPGGRTIPNTVLQVLTAVVDLRMGIDRAVALGRIHHAWMPDELQIEEALAGPEIRAGLEALGHRVRVRAPIGAAECLAVPGRAGRPSPGVDPRAPGGGFAPR